MTSANHSLKELVLRKWGLSCCCKPGSVKGGGLCNHVSEDWGRPEVTTGGCRVSQFANSFYKAIRSRVVEVELKKPFFPKDEDNYERV